MNKKYPIRTLKYKDTLTFGKFKGHKVSELLDCGKDGLRYMDWIERRCSNIKLTPKLRRKIEECRAYYSYDYRDKSMSNHHYSSNYEHYNDMGGMYDVGFDECYGTFGY